MRKCFNNGKRNIVIHCYAETIKCKQSVRAFRFGSSFAIFYAEAVVALRIANYTTEVAKGNEILYNTKIKSHRRWHWIKQINVRYQL